MAVAVVRTAQTADASLSTNAVGGDCLDITVTWRANTGQTISGVTFNSVSCTQIGSTVTASGGSNARFRLVAPDQTTANVVPTFSAAPGNYQITCNVLSGVDQTTPVGDTDSAIGTAVATSTPTVTAAVGDLVIDSLMIRGGPTGITENGGQTALSAQEAASSVYHRTSSEAGAASVDMGWTWTTSSSFAHFIVVYQAAATGSVTKTPAQAVLTVNVLAPLTNAYTFVAIQDTLINESGQVVANAANIRLLVWYNGQAIGAPDYSANGQTSNASGSISWSIAPSGLANGQAIFYLAQDSISYSNYTCGRVVPTYG